MSLSYKVATKQVTIVLLCMQNDASCDIAKNETKHDYNGIEDMLGTQPS
jgi:hypothetical protein